jgi:hypothetical protein
MLDQGTTENARDFSQSCFQKSWPNRDDSAGVVKSTFRFMTINGPCGAVVKQETSTGLQDRRGNRCNTTTHEPSIGVYTKLKYKFFPWV